MPGNSNATSSKPSTSCHRWLWDGPFLAGSASETDMMCWVMHPLGRKKTDKVNIAVYGNGEAPPSVFIYSSEHGSMRREWTGEESDERVLMSFAESLWEEFTGHLI